MKRKLLWVALVALAVAGVVLFIRSRGQPDAGPKANTVKQVERRTLETVVEAAGLLEPLRVVEVKSKASGEVLEVNAETGSRVEQGTLLTSIDPRDVENAFQQANADLTAARVRASTTEAQRKRMESLRATGVVTQQEYEAAIEAAATAKAAAVRAETTLELAKDRRGDVTIKAPITGTLIDRTIEPGQIIASATSNVSGGTTLFKMADLSTMQVRAKVDETDIGKVQPGQRAEVTVEAYPGRRFQGEVAKIEPQAVVEQNVTLFPVLLRLDNAEGLLRPGMNAEVRLEIARKPEVLTVPNQALATPRELGAAAATLGLDEAAVRAAFRAPAADSAPAPLPSGMTPATATATSVAVNVPGAQAGGADCAALRERVRAAGGPQGLSDEDRTALRACRAQGGAGAGHRSRGGGNGESRAAMVFVQTERGIEPRRVTLGIADWDYTEVESGVAEGEKVLLLSVLQLQQKQQEATDRFKQRSGGMMPGSGSGSGRGR